MALRPVDEEPRREVQARELDLVLDCVGSTQMVSVVFWFWVPGELFWSQVSPMDLGLAASRTLGGSLPMGLAPSRQKLAGADRFR